MPTRSLFPFAVLALVACQHPPRVEAQPSATVISNVTLIDGTGAPAQRGVTIIVRDRRIVDIVPAGMAAAVPGAQVIDGTSKYLIPGLIDAHVHLGTIESRPLRLTELMLGNALMGGVPTVGSWFEGARGTYMADGGPIGASALVRLVTDTTDIDAAIVAGKAAGASGIKLYNTITPKSLAAIMRAAEKHRMPVSSHLAVDPLPPSALVGAGVRSVTHADQFIREVVPYPPTGIPQAEAREVRLAGFLANTRETPALQRLFALMKVRGTMLDPTLGIMMPEPDSSGHVLVRDGARQAPNIHHELQLLVDSVGLTPMEAIVAATSNGAHAIGIDSVGVLARGKLADLVLLSADPLTDIANTQTVVGVMEGGRWFPRTSPMPIPPRARPPAR